MVDGPHTVRRRSLLPFAASLQTLVHGKLWLQVLIGMALGVASISKGLTAAAHAGQAAGAAAPYVADLPSHVVTLLPTNPLSSMVESNMLQIVIFAGIFGVTLVVMPRARPLGRRSRNNG